MDMSNPKKGSSYRNWLWIPVAAVCVFLIYWGVFGTKMVVVKPTLDSSSNKTGKVSMLDAAAKTFTLTTDKGVAWNVSFKDESKLFIIKEVNGAKVKDEKQTYADNPGALADNITVTASGNQNKKDMTIKASVLHIGGAENFPAPMQMLENEYIYGTADKLCIACVGLGDSDMNRLWQMGIWFVGFIMVYFLIVIYGKRRGVA